MGVTVPGLSYFRGKTVFVAGATTPLGMSLCHRLADLGATVVAQATDDVPLNSVARHNPDRIETLPLDMNDPTVVRTFGSVWGAEPIDALINLLPLVGPPEATAGLFRALGAALAAGKGRAISGFPEVAMLRPSPDAVFKAAGWRGYLETLRPVDVRHRVLGIRPGRKADLVGLGDLVLMLCHPVSDSLADQSRLEARPAD